MANWFLLISGNIKSTLCPEIGSLNLLWERVSNFIDAHLQAFLSLEEKKINES
jgi:hypothetical protein